MDTAPVTHSMMDAATIGEHSVFISKCAVTEDLQDKEKDGVLQNFGKWLKKENLGTMKKSVFVLNEDAASGRHFADRYGRFHQLARSLAAVTEDDYLYRFHDIRNLTSDLMKAIVDDDDDYVISRKTKIKNERKTQSFSKFLFKKLIRAPSF